MSNYNKVRAGRLGGKAPHKIRGLQAVGRRRRKQISKLGSQASVKARKVRDGQSSS